MKGMDRPAGIAMIAALALAPETAIAQAPAPAPVVAVPDKQALYLAGLKASDGWLATPSGLRYRRIKAGAGTRHPLPTDTVTIDYSGRFIDGTQFDASTPSAPVTFPLPQLIRGWQEGVPLMEVGSTYEFAIPYTLAYGAEGKGPIPGGATLLFTITLESIANTMPG